jgi:hypothetical protein
MLPAVSVTKSDFATGVVAPSDVGILAIIAPAGAASTAPANAPTMYTVDGQALSDFTPSPLVEDLSYVLNNGGGQPVIACRATAATAAVYGTIDVSKMAGLTVVTAGSAVPNDYYDVIIGFPLSGVVGAAGLQWTYSLDGGNSTSGPQALPTGAGPIVITIPNFPAGGSPGVSFSLTAATIVAGDLFRCLVAPAKMTDADLATSLEAMRVTTLPFEGVLIEEDAGPATIGIVDTWLSALEKVGKFKYGLLNTRFKNQLHLGSGAAETETAFATAMTTAVAAMTPTIRCCLGTDGGKVSSTLTGLSQPRHAALDLAARATAIATGVDPAYVDLGPLPGVGIVDNSGNPLFHNEELYPGLDSLLLTSLRTFANQNGVYITNANVFSTVGSDYVFLQHIRTMNQGCELAFAILQKQLGRGVGKKPRDPITGKITILESDALVIEGLVNRNVENALAGQVVAVAFTLSRTDDLSSNAGATVNGYLYVEALAYIKNIKVIAAFQKQIAVALAA